MTRDYLLHLRPRSWPVVAGHALVGYFLAAGADRWLAEAGRGIAAALLWAVCLNGGTLALNSAVDKDGGDVGYLDDPPPPPKGLYAFGLALMVTGQGAALLFFPPVFALFYLACLFLSVAYSTEPLRLKARPGWDLLVNCTGYGVLTTLAGWAAIQNPAPAPVGWIGAGYFLLFAALYPLTQLYQHDDDAAKGDRTLTVRLGKKRALRLAAAAMVLAFGAFAAAGRHYGPLGWWLLAPFAAWNAVFVPWLMGEGRYPEKRGMYRALWAWGVTDIAWIILAVV